MTASRVEKPPIDGESHLAKRVSVRYEGIGCTARHQFFRVPRERSARERTTVQENAELV